MVERAAQPWTAGTHEGRPKTRDDPRAIDVGISSKATQMTAGIGAHEPLARPRADVQAAVAGLAGVLWRAHAKGRPRGLRLVGDDGAQLGKGPAVGAPALGLAARLVVGALADARQVLEGHGAPRLRRACHDGLADYVVPVALEAPLPAGEAFLELPTAPPAAPCPLAGLFLRGGAARVIAVAHKADVPAAVGVSVAGGGDGRPPQVHAQGVRGLT